MSLAPGSLLWLVRNDVRLNWRRLGDLMGAGGQRRLLPVLICGAIALHLAAWPLVGWLGPRIYAAEAPAAPLAAGLACAFTWMIAQSLFGATRTLYDRGDLDLLLGSPLPARRVIAAKAIAIAAGTAGSIAFLVLPIANVGAALDRPAWLAAYPLLAGLALTATAAGLALAIAMFFLLGTRRARVWTQMIGAVLAGAFVLAAQVVAMLPPPIREAITLRVDRAVADRTGGMGAVAWLPVDALRGDWWAMAIVLAIGILSLAAAAALLGERFAGASLAAAGAPSGRQGAGAGLPVFRAGLAACLRRKEWRLLARDPGLFAQLGLQIIYTIPIAVVLLRAETLPAAVALAPTIVVIAAQVAASLAWLTVSGEDAPELIRSAPVTARAVDRAKLGALALPVLVIVALPLAGLAVVSWQAAILAAGLAAAAGTSTALLNFWHPMPGSRRGMLRRHSQSKLMALVEHTLAILWAVATVLALAGSPLALAPVAVVLAVLWWGCKRQRPAQADRTAGPLDRTSRAALATDRR